MDGETGLVIGRSQRERKRSYRDFLLDVADAEEQDSSDQEFIAKEPKAPQNKMRQLCINGREEPYNPGLLPACPVQALRDRWRDGGEGGGEKYDTEDNLLHSVSPAEGAIEEPGSPLAEYWVYLNDTNNSFESTLTSHHDFVLIDPVARHPIISTPASQPTNHSPVMNYAAGGASVSGPMADRAGVGHSPSECADVGGADLVAVNAAAHLHLLGESLALIGHELQETNKTVCASSSVSLLMDSMLCALVPLLSLTSLMPEFRGVSQHTLADAMENIAYMMPGL